MSGKTKMQAAQKDELWAWWHKFEMGHQRLWVAATTLALVLVLIIIGLLYSNSQKDLAIEHLSRHRTMIGFPDASGVFVSQEQIPDHLVVRFGRLFVNNFFNYTPNAVVENLEEARRMMDPRLAIDYHRFFQDTISIVSKDTISQIYDIKAYQLEKTNDGFVVRFQGILTQLAGQTLLADPKTVMITVKLTRVPFTKATPEGLVVTGVSDKGDPNQVVKQTAVQPGNGAP